MMITSSVHNHTLFCDGADSPEALCEAALMKGLKTLGILAHSQTDFDTSYCLKDVDGFFNEVNRIKDKYAIKLDILVGLEVDAFGKADDRCDYVVASVHYLKKDGKFLELDGRLFEKVFLNDFGGDFSNFYQTYFQTILDNAARFVRPIIGHLDLIEKYNDCKKYFDGEDKGYLALAEKTLLELKKQGAIIEVNTGSMSRHNKKEPYPSVAILKIAKRLDCDILLSSDSHFKKHLTAGFDYALSLLKDIGFENIYQLEKEGYKKYKII